MCKSFFQGYCYDSEVDEGLAMCLQLCAWSSLLPLPRIKILIYTETAVDSRQTRGNWLVRLKGYEDIGMDGGLRNVGNEFINKNLDERERGKSGKDRDGK